MGSLPAQVELHAALAQLAVYGADWEQVERSTEASAELAEREGLVGKLCLPIALRGLLRWREGNSTTPTVLFHRAHELAEQVGWSELAFQALFGLATALRDRGDLAGAAAALDRALDVCERAGLIAQSIQATRRARGRAALAAHRREARSRRPQEAAELAERLHYPIGRAAALEAQGVCAEDPPEGAAPARGGAPAWADARPPARGGSRATCSPASCWSTADAERGRTVLGRAANEIEQLGVPPPVRAGAGRWPAELSGRPYGPPCSVAPAIDDHGRVAGERLARRVDRLALGDAQPAADRARLALVCPARTGRPTRRAADRRSW